MGVHKDIDEKKNWNKKIMKDRFYIKLLWTSYQW